MRTEIFIEQNTEWATVALSHMEEFFQRIGVRPPSRERRGEAKSGSWEELHQRRAFFALLLLFELLKLEGSEQAWDQAVPYEFEFAVLSTQ